jgi:2Fe-2S ferredoxin
MTKITYLQADGTENTVEAQPGETLMSAALDNNVPGIDGDCGGNCACATCHVFVEGELVGGAGDEERDMLAIADDVQENSRLGCQILITAEMDGLVIRLPASQH